MSEELQRLKKRFRDLADRSFRQDIFTFTGFLSLAEQEIFWQAAGEAGVKASLSGGASGLERQIGRFGDPEALGYEEAFPIVCLVIEPLSEKFSDEFSHRDFLGAVMNLGIDRSTVGDILIEGKSAYLFCTAAIAGFLSDNLLQVRHTHVRCRQAEDTFTLPERRLLDKDETVSSLRCDLVVSSVWNLSRSQGQELFRQKKVYVNGRLMENNSYTLKAGDTVSVRGFGKFIFRGEKYTTRKGKLAVTVSIYV